MITKTMIFYTIDYYLRWNKIIFIFVISAYILIDFHYIYKFIIPIYTMARNRKNDKNA